MLHARRPQAAGMELERPVLAASRQPVAWSSCRRPAAPGSTNRSPGSSLTRGRSTIWEKGGGWGRKWQAGDKEPLPRPALALTALPPLPVSLWVCVSFLPDGPV